ncbi:LptF/LptG family permease [Sediminispirochaeta bajacaliforniensis]|uniref:LptF/LptG family permease n=1 Tax=Sediminispirochaeta bajacaliforniensis TaxID=148 RepID=UPI00036A7386|nr:LptF/LptG family permease [Sediminispirochaeta bajacaliforniensis]
MILRHTSLRFRIADAYILKEFFFSFCIAFIFFFFIFFVNQLLLLAEEVLSKRVGVTKVFLLILYSLPAILAFTFPFSALLGTVMAIGRFSSDNEITAFRALGVSHLRLFFPVMLLGLILSGISFFSNDVLLPRGTVQFGRLYRDILYSNPALELEPYAVRRYKDTVLVTGAISDREISDLVILDHDEDQNERMLSAKRAYLEQDEKENGVISLRLEEVLGHTAKKGEGDFDYFTADTMEYNILLSSFTYSINNLTPREMSTAALYGEIQTMEAKKKEEQNIKRFDRTLQLYRIEFYKKLAIPLGCFTFMFFAFPAGLLPKRSGRWVGFVLGLFAAAFYWMLLIVGQTIGVRFQVSAALAMWFPNIFIAFIGLLIYLSRSHR